MNIEKYHAFDPYSEESLRIVEEVEALPFDQEFEHLLYDNRIDRVARFEYDHAPDQEYDVAPLVIDFDVMATRFPASLRGIFPEDQYNIEQLKIEQFEGGYDAVTQTLPQTRLLMSFWTHECEHFVTIENGIARYETKNNDLEDTAYTFQPEEIIGLIATFVYAKQYDPAHPNKAIELAESSLFTTRDPRVDFVEQLIMTLGNFTGSSSLETRAMFENSNGSPILATLREQEFPEKSAVSNRLLLNELTDVNEIPTSTETLVAQNIVNINDEDSIIGVGQLKKNFAEQRSTVLTEMPLTTTEYIDSKENYTRWVSICASFLTAIKNV